MITREILEKTCMSKKEIDLFYNSQFEPMAFPWLSDVKVWIEKTFDVRVMTILYEITYEETHKFTLYLYSATEHDKIPLSGGRAFWYGHCIEIENVISNYLKCNGKIECKLTYTNFETSAQTYLFSLLGRVDKIRDEIEPLFDNMNPIYVLLGGPILCVLETKKKARDFLLSESYKSIKKKCFDLLKTYDDYNILREDDVRIIVDYKENYEHASMYSLWRKEMSLEDQKKLEEEIINC